MNEKKELMKLRLKEYLYDLAATSDSPAAELESLISEAITELYWEAKASLQARKEKLRLVQS